jgi:predicted choloylglycine hydrolase
MSKFSFFIILLIFIASKSFACTTIIISGKATKDGRPLMWKNSDTDNPNHSLMYADYHGFPLLGIIRNSVTDEQKASVWAGTNVHGFAIMNTLSYNISEDKENAQNSQNGALMRKALEKCKNVLDFKNFLDTLPRPLKVEANYGTIDAEGNAAYFETNSDGYRMLDVNDPSVAPYGYLVYTNFSYTGVYDTGEGYIRYQTAVHQVALQAPSKDFSPQWIFNNLSRTYYHSLLDISYTDEKISDLFKNGYIADSDFIPRKSTASSTVFQGVKKGENPELTTMWVVLGYPPCSVAIPAWVKAGKDNPYLLMRDDKNHPAKMCELVTSLKETVYDVKRGHGGNYIHFSKIFNKGGTGYMQQLAPVENRIFETVNPLINQWREVGTINKTEIKTLGNTISKQVEDAFEKLTK